MASLHIKDGLLKSSKEVGKNGKTITVIVDTDAGAVFKIMAPGVIVNDGKPDKVMREYVLDGFTAGSGSGDLVFCEDIHVLPPAGK